MKRPRSIRFKLITLYVCLLSSVFLCFGAYVYITLHQLLLRSLDQTLSRRAEQIATTILDELPTEGESYVASEIQARYAPELNERSIRIIDSNGREIYASQNAHFLAEQPIIQQGNRERDFTAWEESPHDWEKYRVVAINHQFPDGRNYLVEVGAPEASISNALEDLVLTFLVGFPVLIGLSILGGYSLLGRALQPVDEIVSAAERITFKNRNKRLPVPQTGDEFERISEALNRMIERLDESFQIANRFSGDASHELRTPLTILQGELESFVSDTSLPPESQERAGDMLEEVVRLSRIVEGLLLVSRLEAGEGQMKRESVDLAEIASSVAEQMALLCHDKPLTFNCDTRCSVIVEGDELRLRQVVVNVIDNAIKYTPEGGTIALAVRSEKQKAVMEVSDTGIGISPEARSKVFDRFFRAEEARANRTPGSGLGLSIVKTIIEAHGGSVSIESNENLGTKCRVELALGEAKNPDSREESLYLHENERR